MITDRDKKFYNYLIRTRLPININDVADMFYPSPTGNKRSSITIAQRRCRELKKLQYIEVSNRSFGNCNYYYVGQKPNERQLRHKLLISHVIATITSNGFIITELEVEKQIMNGEIRCDVFATLEYNGTKRTMIIEVDLTKEFNVDGYSRLIRRVQDGIISFKYPLMIVSVCDFKIESDIKKYIITCKTDLSDFNKFIWHFVK